MNRKQGMFLRILRRAATVRRRGTLTALLATVVASAVVTTMLNLYVDVGSKLQREFRAYGANLVVRGSDGSQLDSETLSRIDSVLAGRGTAAPFAYAIANTASGAPVVVAGTDMERARGMNRWWSVSRWPNAQGEALVGVRAAAAVNSNGRDFELVFRGKTHRLRQAGTLQTGADEDSRVYISLAEFQEWTGLTPSVVEVAAAGSAADVEAMRGRLAAAIPGTEVKPIRQIVEAEARVLEKTRASLLASVVLIVVTAALCVFATLMTWVLEQRKNVAVMKALGASERLINGLFAAQVAGVSGFGAVLGFLIGIGVAAWIGAANFHTAIVPRLSVFPPVFAGSVLLALGAAAAPVILLRRLQPAAILRGE